MNSFLLRIGSLKNYLSSAHTNLLLFKKQSKEKIKKQEAK